MGGRHRRQRGGRVVVVGALVALLLVVGGVAFVLGRGGAADAPVPLSLAHHPGSAIRRNGATCAPGVTTVASVADTSAPQGRRSVWIHRPAGPDRATVPVLYFLHGFPSDPESMASGQLTSLLDDLMCQSGVPFVIAIPDGRSADIDTEWGDDAAGRFSIETFVSDTAITLVEGNLRRTSDLRALAGFSMGGYGAAALALRHPDKYQQVAVFSGYFHVDDPDGVFGQSPDQHAPDQLLNASAGQRYFLVEGTEEDTPLLQGSIRGEAERFAALLRGRAAAVTVTHPTGGHDDPTWFLEFGDMVDFLDVGWANAAGSR
jgi:enterochelin esterase-like enzyme